MLSFHRELTEDKIEKLVELENTVTVVVERLENVFDVIVFEVKLETLESRCEFCELKDTVAVAIKSFESTVKLEKSSLTSLDAFLFDSIQHVSLEFRFLFNWS